MADAFLKSMYSKTPKHHEAFPKKKFKPWHKPRKQYVRKKQWRYETEILLRELKPSLDRDSRPLRYLSLPGDDMLDVRVMSEVCEEQGLRLSLLGFNTAGTEAQVSIHESISYITPNSIITPSDLYEIAEKDSLAYAQMRECGPFDVVNIDLCNSVASYLKRQEAHTAFTNLFEYQINKRTEPWLFFITMRCDSGSVCQEVLEQYYQNVDENVGKSNEFKNILEAKGHQIQDGKINRTHNTRLKTEIFPVCFGKWLLGVLTSVLDRWNLKMLKSYTYKVTPGGLLPDMLSLAYLLKPIEQSLSDPVGIASMTEDSHRRSEYCGLSEEEQAIDLAHQSFDLTDIDRMLVEDRATMERMTKESALLMAEARYSEEEYLQWAQSGCPNQD